jgi:hypothetical protein
MIKCLANRALEFSNGVDKAATKVGFCELPDWAAKTPYFKAALLDGSIKAFESNSDKANEDLLKDEEKAAKLKEEIAELEKKKASLESKNDKAKNTEKVK